MAQLAEMAYDMEQQALRRGVSYRELSRGLSLSLVIAGGKKVLTLARPAVKPSDDEISTCRLLFRVPMDAQRDDGGVTVTLRWPS